MTPITHIRCGSCGKTRPPSGWEQRFAGRSDYLPLCNRCANRRLDNPWNALLDLRKCSAPRLGAWETP